MYAKDANCLDLLQWKVTVVDKNVLDITSVTDKSNNSSSKMKKHVTEKYDGDMWNRKGRNNIPVTTDSLQVINV